MSSAVRHEATAEQIGRTWELRCSCGDAADVTWAFDGQIWMDSFIQAHRLEGTPFRTVIARTK